MCCCGVDVAYVSVCQLLCVVCTWCCIHKFNSNLLQNQIQIKQFNNSNNEHNNTESTLPQQCTNWPSTHHIQHHHYHHHTHHPPLCQHVNSSSSPQVNHCSHQHHTSTYPATTTPACSSSAMADTACSMWSPSVLFTPPHHHSTAVHMLLFPCDYSVLSSDTTASPTSAATTKQTINHILKRKYDN